MSNDYYFDSSCKAAYRFEAGYLRTDSQSENHLTAVHSPTESPSDFKEDLCAARLSSASSQYFYCPDSNLTEDFPLKWDSDPAVVVLRARTISCCLWLKFNSTSGRQNIVGKYDPATNQRSFMIYSQDGNLRVAWGYNDGFNETVLVSGLTFNTGIWYHVGISIDNAEQAAIFEVWNDSTDTVDCRELKEFILTPLAITPAALSIGADHSGNNCLDALIDELLIFNTRKSPVEFALIRHGNYTGPRANCFFFDPNCVSEYSFEIDPGGLLDSIGTNHLTDYNTVHYDSGPWQEQGRSLYLYRPELEYLQRPDSDLSAGFPLKFGNTTKTFTMCFWLRFDARTGTYSDIVSKSSTVNGKKSFCIYLQGSQLYFYWGYNSGNSNEAISSTSISLDRWYHLGVAVNGGPSPSILFRLYDSVQQKVITHTIYHPTNELFVGTGPFSVGLHQGASNPFYGWIDELVIFSDLKSKFEMDAIRNGDYFRPLRWGSVETEGHTTPYIPEVGTKVISDGALTAYRPNSEIKVISSGIMVLARVDFYRFYSNFFGSDPNVVAVYLFEDVPGFANDSTGRNDLTNVGPVEKVE